ncbi:L-rhamnose-binding lectin ELEL-1-like [Aethina tumida]|uniref:L-rhamnose-binding lectin ELEL-1-like n=1 Tax=Aethina tumida TaxID=116153 RepID=UPI0021489322|nr:L-rhamnose-binding lectin ELEL-1-like [Aethina tumida]
MHFVVYCLWLLFWGVSGEPTKIVCEGGTGVLDCGTRVIEILCANYGRLDLETCKRTDTSVQNSVNCRAPNSLSIVKQQCNDKHTCTLNASNSVFGDPCANTTKYLEVEYECIDSSKTCGTGGEGNCPGCITTKCKIECD